MAPFAVVPYQTFPWDAVCSGPSGDRANDALLLFTAEQGEIGMSFRGINTTVIQIRRQVFTEVARMAYANVKGEKANHLMRKILYTIIPGEGRQAAQGHFPERAPSLRGACPLAMGLPTAAWTSTTASSPVWRTLPLPISIMIPAGERDCLPATHAARKAGQGVRTCARLPGTPLYGSAAARRLSPGERPFHH